jgi:hypothetical protein
MDQGLVKTAVSNGLLREEWPEYRLVIPAEEPVSRQVKQLRIEWDLIWFQSVSINCPALHCCLKLRGMEIF